MSGKFLSGLKKAANTLWYEKEQDCLLCGNRQEQVVCPACEQAYFLLHLKRCRSCGKILSLEKEQCRDCQEGKGPESLAKATSLGYYHGRWQEFIHRVKYKDMPYLLIPMSERIVPWVTLELPVPHLIVPVPAHPHRLGQRGYNQTEVLGSILGRKLGIPCQESLERIKDTPPQSSLGRLERLHNVQGAIGLKEGARVSGKVIWLVDDVVTTGATLGECAETLQRQGASLIYAFCLGAGLEEV